MSLESVFANAPPSMAGVDNNHSGEEDKERMPTGSERVAHSAENTVFLEEGPDDSFGRHTTTIDPSDKADLEDGELEDGEIDDDEDLHILTSSQALTESVTEVVPDLEPSTEVSQLKGVSPSNDEVSPAKSDSEESEDNDDREKRRKKKKKKRKREEKEKDKRKKKKKNPKYVDHDQVDDDEYPGYHSKSSKWPGGYSRRSPPGPYDSPYDSPPSHERSPSHAFMELGGSKGLERSPPGSYDNPYGSPPGPYDSPSDEEDKYGLLQLARMEGKADYHKKQSMLDLLDTDYMDPSVAANEREELFDRKRKSGDMTASKMRKLEKTRRYKEIMRQREQESLTRKTTPRRQQCKFFMDGKCQRGGDCPFSHDFKPPRKLEVCKFYMINACAKGEKCLYMHDDYPCRAFLLEGKCPDKDDCLFSHLEIEEYEEEVQPLIEKFLRGEDYESTQRRDRDSPRKRPSLLGSPPRLQDTKNIPSIFDIKVYPPGQAPPAKMGAPTTPPAGPRPVGPPGSGPRGPIMPPPGIPGPVQNRPVRPNFYGEMGSPARMSMGLGGPGLMGMPGPSRGPMMMPPNMLTPGMDAGGPVFRPPGPANFFGGFYQPQPGDQPPDIESPEVKDGQDGSLQEKKKDSSDDGCLPDDLSIPGVDKCDLEDIAAHLPPVQRELFLRIQRQQQQKIPDSAMAKQKDEDEDNWYSSDEEDGSRSQKKQRDAKQQRAPISTQGKAAPDLPVSQFDISQMLSAIRQSMGPLPGTASFGQGNTGLRDPRVGTGSTPHHSDPQSMKSTDPRSAKVRTGDPRRSSGALIHGIHLAVPEIDATISSTGGVPYRIHTIVVPLEKSLPSHVDVNDPKYQIDPRVNKPDKRKSEVRMRRQSTEIVQSKGKDPRISKTASEPRGLQRQQQIEELGVRPQSASLEISSSPPQESHVSGDLISSKDNSATGALTQLPKLLDPRLARQFSGSASTSIDLDTDSIKTESRLPFSHRNDPRFKFKKKPRDSSQSAEDDSQNAGIQPGQDTATTVTSIPDVSQSKDPRKRGLEHASPLEVNSEKLTQSYDLYNKPPNPNFSKKRKNDTVDINSSAIISASVDVPIIEEDVKLLPGMADSMDNLPPDLPMKDIFKTIDPTASPFC